MDRMTRVISFTAAIAVVAAIGIFVLGLLANWALAVVVAIMVGGLAALIIPLESILSEDRSPRARRERRHG
jgi:Na+/citrate or Na+/malate symporter